MNKYEKYKAKSDLKKKKGSAEKFITKKGEFQILHKEKSEKNS